MPTTTQRPSRARKPAAAQAYPEHQDAHHPGFFLACMLREQSQYEELLSLTKDKGFFKKTDQFKDAIHTAAGRTYNEIQKSLKYVISDGLLPYAHAHTTFFDQQVAQ